MSKSNETGFILNLAGSGSSKPNQLTLPPHAAFSLNWKGRDDYFKVVHDAKTYRSKTCEMSSGGQTFAARQRKGRICYVVDDDGQTLMEPVTLTNETNKDLWYPILKLTEHVQSSTEHVQSSQTSNKKRKIG
jgi:hypothetical protein